MGKSTRRKQEKLAEQENQVIHSLSVHREKKPARGVVTANTKGVMNKALRVLNLNYIRPINDWVYKGKSKDVSKQRLSLLRHLCGKYPVPSFLERPLLVDDDERTTDSERFKYIDWYIAIAQGQSLYKTCTNGILTKKETHLLLQAPNELNINAAVWWAKSMAINGDIGIAYRMARSRIVDRGDFRNEFWNDVHRFFTNNPVSLEEISDLLDYIVSERHENKNWTIKKRSLEAVRRKSEEWHRAQYKMKNIGGGSWNGMDMPTWKITLGKDDPNPQKSTLITYTVRQILTGNELAKEGQAMRHCVASYKGRCMTGSTAIFSMTSDTMMQLKRRNLTIEVDAKARRIAQARGLANRMPRPQEEEVLRLWAKDNDLTSYRNSWY